MPPMSTLLAVLSCVALVVAQCPSGQKTAIGAVWSDNAAWCPSGIPVANDNVEIPSGIDMLVDVSTPRLGWVLIKEGGKLRFHNGLGAEDVELLFQAETILNKGYLEMGRELAPLTRPVRVKLLALSTPPARALDTSMEKLFLPPYGQKMLAVVGEGIWDAHGSGRKVMWTKLSATVNVGATSISLIEAVDWKVGDEIIICTTDFPPEQTERRFVTSISADGLTVGVNTPLTYSHYGVSKMIAGFPVDMRGEVGVLTSNFVIEGDMVDSPKFTPEPYVESNGLTKYVMFGGHTVSVDRSFVRLSGIEFKAMGQGGRLARYPVHWHHRMDAPGQYIKRCSIHDTFSRGITVHDTNRLVIENTINFNVYGHSIYLEDGTEELNQFYNNLVVTSLRVGTGADDYLTGSWKFPECGSVQPGLRLQYLDFQPSGFWITSANNTFVGNVAVGHDWGFWIRVDFVFDEPLFPGGCAVCCPGSLGDRSCNCTQYWKDRDHPERAIDIASSGLIFIDNVAHSNIQGGWWAKENWQPSKTSTNVIDGMLLYKNLVGLDNYGIANLNFTRIVAADNAAGAHIDWVRHDQATFSNSLLMGETENHGNPQAVSSLSTPQIAGTPSASLIFPNVNRTTSTGMSYLGQYCLRVGDTYHHLQDIVFYNCKKPAASWTSQPYFNDYLGENYLGSMTFHVKTNWAGPDREFSGLYWVNSELTSRLRGTKFDSTTRQDVSVPLFKSGGSLEYGSGFHDVDGSFPCSVPGAWWLSNTPSMVPPECEYRSYANMYYCQPGGFAYRQLYLTSLHDYNGNDWMPGAYPVLTWECDKVLLPVIELNYQRRYSLHTQKNYVVSMMQSDGQTEVTYDAMADTVGLTFEFPRWDVFEGMDFVVRVPGTWTATYYIRQPDRANPLLVDAPAAYIQSTCACGVTYAKITTKGNRAGPWPGPMSSTTNQTTYFPERGWEIHFTKNAAINCPAAPCGNPYAAPNPTNCGTPNAVNDMDLRQCAVRPAPTAVRPWVTRPAMISHPIPSLYVFPPSPEVVASGASLASLSGLCLLLLTLA